MIVEKYGIYVRKCMWQLCGQDRDDISLTVHSRAILKIVKSMSNARPPRFIRDSSLIRPAAFVVLSIIFVL
jgi:hypothetical protein